MYRYSTLLSYSSIFCLNVLVSVFKKFGFAIFIKISLKPHYLMTISGLPTGYLAGISHNTLSYEFDEKVCREVSL